MPCGFDPRLRHQRPPSQRKLAFLFGAHKGVEPASGADEQEEERDLKWPIPGICRHSIPAASAPASLRSLRRTAEEYASVVRLAGAAHRRSRCFAIFPERTTHGARKPGAAPRRPMAKPPRLMRATPASGTMYFRYLHSVQFPLPPLT